MFDSYDSIQSGAYWRETCLLDVPELVEADPTPLVRRLSEYQLLGRPAIAVLPPDMTRCEWPWREPEEAHSLYLKRLPEPAQIESENRYRIFNEWEDVEGDRCPIDTNELKDASGNPFAAALFRARESGKLDRSVLAPKHTGEDWPDSLASELAEDFLYRTAREMISATYRRAVATCISEAAERIPVGEVIS